MSITLPDKRIYSTTVDEISTMLTFRLITKNKYLVIKGILDVKRIYENEFYKKDIVLLTEHEFLEFESVMYKVAGTKKDTSNKKTHDSIESCQKAIDGMFIKDYMYDIRALNAKKKQEVANQIEKSFKKAFEIKIDRYDSGAFTTHKEELGCRVANNHGCWDKCWGDLRGQDVCNVACYAERDCNYGNRNKNNYRSFTVTKNILTATRKDFVKFNILYKGLKGVVYSIKLPKTNKPIPVFDTKLKINTKTNREFIDIDVHSELKESTKARVTGYLIQKEVYTHIMTIVGDYSLKDRDNLNPFKKIPLPVKNMGVNAITCCGVTIDNIKAGRDIKTGDQVLNCSTDVSVETTKSSGTGDADIKSTTTSKSGTGGNSTTTVTKSGGQEASSSTVADGDTKSEIKTTGDDRDTETTITNEVNNDNDDDDSGNKDIKDNTELWNILKIVGIVLGSIFGLVIIIALISYLVSRSPQYRPY